MEYPTEVFGPVTEHETTRRGRLRRLFPEGWRDFAYAAMAAFFALLAIDAAGLAVMLLLRFG